MTVVVVVYGVVVVVDGDLVDAKTVRPAEYLSLSSTPYRVEATTFVT